MLRTCAQCHTSNRVPPRHLSSRGKCGSCGATLAPLDTPLDVNPAEFDAITREARVPVVVDFWAAWCGPCRMVAPEVKKLAHHLAGEVVVLKVDTEQHPELAARFQVQGIPNFVLLRDGQLRAQRPGYAAEPDLAAWVRASAT